MDSRISLYEDLSKQYDALNNQYSELQSQYRELNDQLASTLSQLEAAKSSAANETYIEQLEQKTASLQKQIEVLNADIEGAIKEKERLYELKEQEFNALKKLRNTSSDLTSHIEHKQNELKTASEL